MRNGEAIHCGNETAWTPLKNELSHMLGRNYKVSAAMKLNRRFVMRNGNLKGLNTPKLNLLYQLYYQ